MFSFSVTFCVNKLVLLPAERVALTVYRQSVVILTVYRQSGVALTVYRQFGVALTVYRQSVVILTVYRQSGVALTVYRQSGVALTVYRQSVVQRHCAVRKTVVIGRPVIRFFLAISYRNDGNRFTYSMNCRINCQG